MSVKKTDPSQSWLNRKLELLQLHLSRPDALIQLAILGLLSGIVAGTVIVLFRLLVEGIQSELLQGNSENYESLGLEARLLFPVAGSLIIALAFMFCRQDTYMLGVARVMERVTYHQGYLTLRSFFMQFFGAAIAIISGHSVGREGPHVFLGAASASLLGQYLKLPNNSIRTLVGCGTAAGIAASFNTPLAGVIFALEVVMMEYTLASFMPVILAAGSADLISVWFFGNEPAFILPEIHFGGVTELPWIILLGLLAGTLSAAFVHFLQQMAHHTRQLKFSVKIMLAGIIVGLIATVEPGVMGIGYDSVNAILSGEIVLDALILLLILKMLATVASVGLGVPGGMIGPALFLGGCLGGIFALSIPVLFPNAGLDNGLYSLLGMGAVMGASLQAPLAALTAMMELSHSPQIIMPGMIAIVVANLTASELFRKKSLFITMLEANDIKVDANPVTQTLRRIGVASVMNKAFIQIDQIVFNDNCKALLLDNPDWILIKVAGSRVYPLLPAIDLVTYLEQNTDRKEGFEINLLEMPARRIEAAPIHLQATLEEALNELDRLNIDALYVERLIAPGIPRIYGILTRAQIESAYQFKN